MNFARYLRHLFDRPPPGDCFCSNGKYFTNKRVKNPLKKKLETTSKKNNDIRRHTPFFKQLTVKESRSI